MLHRNWRTTPTLFAVGADFGEGVVQLGHLGQFGLDVSTIRAGVAVGIHDMRTLVEFYRTSRLLDSNEFPIDFGEHRRIVGHLFDYLRREGGRETE